MTLVLTEPIFQMKPLSLLCIYNVYSFLCYINSHFYNFRNLIPFRLQHCYIHTVDITLKVYFSTYLKVNKISCMMYCILVF